MATNFVTSFIQSISEDPVARDQKIHKHVVNESFNADARLIDEAKWRRPKGFHRQEKYANPEGVPHLPRQFVVSDHSDTSDYKTYAANSYSSAIAVTEIMGKREI